MALIWLDPTSPPVRSAVISGGWGRAPHSAHGTPVPPSDEIDPVAVALARASERLARLTGSAVHPAGTAIEQFTGGIRPARLRLQMQPVRLVQTVSRRGADGTLAPTTEQWFPWTGGIQFAAPRLYGGVGLCSDLGPWHYEVRYRFGSTITAGAREAVLELAHQFWLASSRCEDCDECALPDNVTSVTREGLTYSMDTPSPLVGGYDKTGLLEVDRWVGSVNPRSALAPAGVYTGDVLPGVIRSLVDARPTWAA